MSCCGCCNSQGLFRLPVCLCSLCMSHTNRIRFIKENSLFSGISFDISFIWIPFREYDSSRLCRQNSKLSHSSPNHKFQSLMLDNRNYYYKKLKIVTFYMRLVTKIFEHWMFKHNLLPFINAAVFEWNKKENTRRKYTKESMMWMKRKTIWMRWVELVLSWCGYYTTAMHVNTQWGEGYSVSTIFPP